MKTQMLASVLALTLSSTAAFADSIRFGAPAFGGTGCPSGSTSIELSPDGSAFALSLDRFVVEAGGSTGRRIDRKSCNLAVPIHVPAGYSISVLSPAVHGFASLPAGSKGQMTVESFFAGAQGPRSQRTFSGPTASDFMFTPQLTSSAQVWSACGASVNLRINLSASVQASAEGADALMEVDTLNPLNSGLFRLQWRACR